MPQLQNRRWWDALRDAFRCAITAGWLLVLDESMVRWLGRGMPGLMVVLRKPTPVGLELHTLCCALSGILIYFEVYEGKERMEQKEYVDKYPKSVALSLRLTKPFHALGKVLIADSWFGSVACILALFQHGVFAVMNVKTAHKHFPKDELLELVGEIKGKDAAAKADRAARRGAQASFVRRFTVGSHTVNVMAAGHNRKLPLLLVSTFGSMLPGNEHVKRWSVPAADGTIQHFVRKCQQTVVHELYRSWMMVVDVHNHYYRQGNNSMADVWDTKNWTHRHFAEGIGFWVVNVYRALVYFYPQHKDLGYTDFRFKLAWAFLTLGKVPYGETPSPAAATPQAAGTPEVQVNATAEYMFAGGEHEFDWWDAKRYKHMCGYCGNYAYKYCTTCHAKGRGKIVVCGRGTKRGSECIDRHATGEPPKHGSHEGKSKDQWKKK